MEHFKNILCSETLKENVIYVAIFVLFFETLQDFIIDQVKFFYNDNWDQLELRDESLHIKRESKIYI